MPTHEHLGQDEIALIEKEPFTCWGTRNVICMQEFRPPPRALSTKLVESA
ncbi:MAG TPA: hypothetical protein VEJ45_05785 [Candidatus Acidoferrales bacterium]|nr:hypothetical protein [Candidatus Acidoferrales bacterium]